MLSLCWSHGGLLITWVWILCKICWCAKQGEVHYCVSLVTIKAASYYQGLTHTTTVEYSTHKEWLHTGNSIYMYTFSALSCHSITSNRVHPFYNILYYALLIPHISIPAPLPQTPPHYTPPPSLPGESCGSGTALSACIGGWRIRGGWGVGRVKRKMRGRLSKRRMRGRESKKRIRGRESKRRDKKRIGGW